VSDPVDRLRVGGATSTVSYQRPNFRSILRRGVKVLVIAKLTWLRAYPVASM